MESLQNVVSTLLSPAADLSHAPNLKGKVVLVRVDFNVPLSNGIVSDWSRVEAALPTIHVLQKAESRVVLLSHLGRPKPEKMSESQLKQFTMKPLVSHLKKALGSSFLGLAPGTLGTNVEAHIAAIKPGQVLLLENVRFLRGEEACAEDVTRALAKLGDAFVLDAFGVCHREQASVTGLARAMPVVYPGLLVRKEVQYLTTTLQDPRRPFVVIVGGAKVADKIGVLWAMIDCADKVVIGGRMAFTFLAAKGVSVGQTAIEEGWLTRAAQMIDYAARKGVELLLPVDVICTYDLDKDASCCTRPLTVDCCSADAPCIPADAFGADIGPKTASLFSAALTGCSTIFWNGPMGRFELSAYAEGTEEIAHSVAAAGKAGATTIIAGGDSVSAVKQLKLDQYLSHLSTGGGAGLELLEGKRMAGLRAVAERLRPAHDAHFAPRSSESSAAAQRELSVA